MTDTFAHHFHTDLLIQKKPENKLQQIEKKKQQIYQYSFVFVHAELK